MTVPEAARPTASGRISSAWRNRLGWIAVALSSLVTSFFAMFAFGESMAWGHLPGHRRALDGDHLRPSGRPRRLALWGCAGAGPWAPADCGWDSVLPRPTPAPQVGVLGRRGGSDPGWRIDHRDGRLPRAASLWLSPGTRRSMSRAAERAWLVSRFFVGRSLVEMGQVFGASVRSAPCTSSPVAHRVGRIRSTSVPPSKGGDCSCSARSGKPDSWKTFPQNTRLRTDGLDQ